MTEKAFMNDLRNLLNDLKNFNEIFREDVTYNNIKSHKKTELHPLFRRYSFGKTTGDSIEPSPPVFLELKKNKSLKTSNNSRNNYMLGVNNINPEERCEMCS